MIQSLASFSQIFSSIVYNYFLDLMCSNGSLDRDVHKRSSDFKLLQYWEAEILDLRQLERMQLVMQLRYADSILLQGLNFARNLELPALFS
jgi:hypothetical protein